MITVCNNFDRPNEDKIIFNDKLFKLIGYIDTENFIIFHTNKHAYESFLNYNFYTYDRLVDFIDYSHFDNLKPKSLFIPDIFKNEIDKNCIDFDINDKSLSIYFKEICTYSKLYMNFNTTLPLNPNFIANLKKEKEKLSTLITSISHLNYNKRKDLFNFYVYKPGGFQKLNIKMNNSFKNNSIFLNLFSTHYNSAEKFNNLDIINLIRAILRNMKNTAKLNEVSILHNGIKLNIFKYPTWKTGESVSGGYYFTNFGQDIVTDRAIDFLKMTPNFKEFLYQLEKIHLAQV